MATKKKAQATYVEQQALDGFAAFGKDTVQDWTAQLGFEWEPLLGALADAGAAIMLRSSDHGRALSVGLFCGGAPAWVTARETAELHAVLQQALVTLQSIAERTTVPLPTAKGKRAGKAPS